VQGLTVAGEETVVQVPELDVAFDVGLCPRSVLAAKYIALTHGHMDHVAGLSYYFSQRHFQGMGVGTVVCPAALEQPIHGLMRAWVDIELQRTPYNVVPLQHEQELEIKNNHFLRAFDTVHTAPSLGYTVVEKRSKLRADLVGLPQDKLVELKQKGEQITQTVEVPLVCYTGDTAWGTHFDRPDVLGAQILITECTFVEPGDQQRSAVGKHLHLSDIVRLVERSSAQAVILTHLSRRTNLERAKKQIAAALLPADRDRVFVLMDHRANHLRYEQQERQAAEAQGSSGSPPQPVETE
jgi:ribonuclease Z